MGDGITGDQKGKANASKYRDPTHQWDQSLVTLTKIWLINKSDFIRYLPGNE